MKEFPDVPTLKDLGYYPWGVDSNGGIIGPAGMDKSAVKILHDAFKEAMNDPVFMKTCENLFMPNLYLNSEDYDKYMRTSFSRLGEAVRMVGLEKKK